MQDGRWIAAACLLAFVGGAGGARAQQAGAPAEGPQIMLDTGGHMAAVVDVAVTSDGRQIVSASNDKTIRVWDIETGKTVRIIRGEVGPGHWGVIHAMALSPDGKWLAVGGQFHATDRTIGSAIRLYDFASGRMERTLKGHENVVGALAFSPDASRILSGSADKTAILWERETGRQILRLKDHAGTVDAVAISPDGARLLTGGSDETLRLWNAADGGQIAEMTEHRLQRERAAKPGHNGNVHAAAFSPDGAAVASGSADGRLLLWDGRTGAFLRQLAFPGGMAGFSAINALRFSADGRVLLSASAFAGCQFYDVASGKRFVDGALRDPAEVALTAQGPRCTGGLSVTPDGKVVAAAYNSTVQLIDFAKGTPSKVLQSVGRRVEAVGFAPDGSAIAWGWAPKKAGPAPLTHRLQLPADGAALAAPEKVASDAPGNGMEAYLRGSAKSGPLTVAFRPAGKALVNVRYLDIARNGEKQAEIDLGETTSARSISPIGFTPDGASVLIGLGPSIEVFDLAGKPAGKFVGHTGEVRDFVPSADGRLLASASADQTVRLWTLKDRELVVSLFQGKDGEWVIWTPQGHYAASPGGEERIGWQVNKGPDQAADHMTAGQLQDKKRPDLVARAIALASSQ